jgi:hypothetical protein
MRFTGHAIQGRVRDETRRRILEVSTREQGRSGLSLVAQRFDIEAFGAREGFRVRSWYQDVQTGAGKDPLPLRPGLATAAMDLHRGFGEALSRVTLPPDAQGERATQTHPQ